VSNTDVATVTAADAPTKPVLRFLILRVIEVVEATVMATCDMPITFARVVTGDPL
jgi:hypothetical protein